MAQMYSYNGTELPPLPEWDRETYPYAYVFTRNDWTPTPYLAYFTSKPFFYGEWTSSAGTTYSDAFFFIVSAGEIGGYQSCSTYGPSRDDTNWTELNTKTYDRSNLSTDGGTYLSLDTFALIWCSVDMPNKLDGTTYLAATDPVFVYNATDFWNGVACGLSGTGVPDFAVESGKCLYNGTELPPLPEWDREKYPYAVIRENSSGVVSVVCFTEQIVQYGSNVDGVAKPYIVFAGGKATTTYNFTLSNNAWGAGVARTTDRTNYGTTYSSLVKVYWSNFDIPNTDDGTTYLAATAPVFLFNATDCFTRGYLAGAELRRNRPKPKIVAYSYNGVELPDIYSVYTPEVQATHPYAVILQYKDLLLGDHTFILYLMKDIGDRDTTDPDTLGNTYENMYHHAGDIQYSLEYDNGELVSGWGEPMELTESLKFRINKIIWADSDIVLAFDTSNGTAGTVKVAASDPVPVYG